MPNVATANSAGKVPVLPRVIEVIVGVSRAAIVSNPFAIGVDVRSIGVPGRVAIVPRLRCGRGMRLDMCLGRAMFGDVMPSRFAPLLFTLALTALGPSRN